MPSVRVGAAGGVIAGERAFGSCPAEGPSTV